MGADLIVTFAYAPQATDGTLLDWANPSHRAVIEARLGEVDADTLIATYFEAFQGGLDEQPTATEAREALTDAVEKMFDVDRRDVVAIKPETKWVWLTGGMSWGDTPSEVYDHMTYLALLEPFEQPFDLKETVDA